LEAENVNKNDDFQTEEDLEVRVFMRGER